MKRLLQTTILLCLVIGAHQNVAASNPDVLFGKMVFMRMTAPNSFSQIFVMDESRKAPVQLTTEGNNLAPQWSPDGTRILFSSDRRAAHGNGEIYVMDADGKHERRLTYTPDGHCERPRWGATGTDIYYEASTPAGMSVRRLVLATGKIEVVAGVKGDVRDQLGSDQKNTPIKSEDLASILKRLRQNSEELEQRGRFAVRLPGRYPSFDGKYTILSSTYFSRLQLLDNQTGTTKVIKESGAYNPAWLKDSKKIVWGSGYPPEQQLVIYDVETGSSQEINIKNEGDDTSCNEPAVGRNSEYIAYVCGTPYSPIDDNWIYILDLKTGASVKLVPGNSPDLY